MQFTIEVNNRKIKAEKGETILSALNRNGILIPTLCRMKEFSPTGACRLCVVEVEGRDRLVTACSQPVEEWMRIKTHSPRVIKSRKTIVELLLSNHPDECLYCDRNLNCELQSLAEELNISERRIRGKKIKMRLDQSSPAVVRELSKCILCGRCIRVCEEQVTANTLGFLHRGNMIHVGTAMDRDFNISSCIHCGQCIIVCPTGALHEKHNTPEVLESLSREDVFKVVQYSPAVPHALAEILDVKYSKDFDRVLNALFRKIGFDKVYNTGFAIDFYIDEMAELLIRTKEEGAANPVYLSACPAWIKYAEQSSPEVLTAISPLKPPQQIAGALIKSIIADDLKREPADIYSVAVTPCIAMKFESRREAMVRKGVSDVDTVLTVMELARLVRLYGVDVTNLSGEQADEPMNYRSASSLLAEVAGGYTEAVVRSLLSKSGDKDNHRKLFRKLRSGSGFREITVEAGSHTYRLALVDGLKSIEKLNAALQQGREYDMIEVMACPSGCVNGGGLSFSSSRDVVRSRTKSIYQAEESEAISIASGSPALLAFRERYSELAEEYKQLLFTTYKKRDVLL